MDYFLLLLLLFLAFLALIILLWKYAELKGSIEQRARQIFEKWKEKELEEFLRPSHVFAVVGATPKREKYGYKIFKSLKEAGYKVYAVNPNHEEIEGERCYASLSELPEKPDVVDIVVPGRRTLTYLEVCKGGLKTVLRTAPDTRHLRVASPAGSSLPRASLISPKQGRLARLSLLRPLSDFHRLHLRGLQRVCFMLKSEGYIKLSVTVASLPALKGEVSTFSMNASTRQQTSLMRR